MAKRILLLRHGQVRPDAVGCLLGSTDLPLDATGQAQALAAACRVARFGPQRCYASPLVRCRQTAVAAVPGMEVRFDDGLREIDFGRWETRRFDELAAADPGLVDRWAAFAPDFAFPGGDSVAGFLQRVHAAAERLVRDDADTVLAVAHGGVIRVMLCYFLGLEPRQYVLFHVGYTGLAVFDLFDGGARHAERACYGAGVLAALENIDG